MKYLLVIGTFLFSLSAFAFADVAMMTELISTTVKQLNELERLVSNAEKYTQKMREYNELYEDQSFKAERVLYLAEELAKKEKIENLGELNNQIRRLKYTYEELQEKMRGYAKIKNDEEKTLIESEEQKHLIAILDRQAKRQVANSINARNTGRATQLTAQNTALIYEEQLKQSKIQQELLQAQKTANRLKAEELEDKRLEEMNQLKFYKRKMDRN